MDALPSLKPQWFQILLAIADHELHGLGIMKEVLEQTDGNMRLWPAMLYGSLKKMVEAGLVEEREGPVGPGADSDRRRFYGITDAGRASLSAEVSRLAKYVEVAEKKSIAIDTVRL
jgi:DNA-binding PadR family transcriptional regulator